MFLDDSNIDPIDIKNVESLMCKGDVSTRSDIVSDFEVECAQYLGVDETIATNSGTSALHVALLAAGIGKGDEVILPATTFIATANAIKYVGATPVFVDVDPLLWCIDPTCAKNALTDKTKAIMSVDLYGMPCWDLHKFVTEHELIWISDSCESLGSKDMWGNMLPEMADYVCYSFNGNKIMTTGSGGLITSKYRDMRWARETVNVGRSEFGDFQTCGYNYKMNGMQAALGLSQLERMYEFINKKRKIHEIYRNELDSKLDFQETSPEYIPNYWFTAATHESNLHIVLMSQGIPFRKVFSPLALMSLYCEDEFNEPNFKVGIELYNNGACLPSSTLNEEKDIMKVCKILKGIL